MRTFSAKPRYPDQHRLISSSTFNSESSQQFTRLSSKKYQKKQTNKAQDAGGSATAHTNTNSHPQKPCDTSSMTINSAVGRVFSENNGVDDDDDDDDDNICSDIADSLIDTETSVHFQNDDTCYEDSFIDDNPTYKGNSPTALDNPEMASRCMSDSIFLHGDHNRRTSSPLKPSHPSSSRQSRTPTGMLLHTTQLNPMEGEQEMAFVLLIIITLLQDDLSAFHIPHKYSAKPTPQVLHGFTGTAGRPTFILPTCDPKAHWKLSPYVITFYSFAVYILLNMTAVRLDNFNYIVIFWLFFFIC